MELKQMETQFMTPHGEFVNRNVVYKANSLEETAKEFSLDINKVIDILDDSREILFNKRRTRPRPHLDDKILTDWNGLMISAFVKAALVFESQEYKSAAINAAEFITDKLYVNNKLLHRYRDGEAGINATLEDYAFFSNALLDLFELTQQVQYLDQSIKLSHDMIEMFWDEENGGFYLTADDAEDLIVRPKEIYDGAYPSGNSIAALVLLKLYHITLDSSWVKKGEDLFKAFSYEINSRPFAFSQCLIAYQFMQPSTYEIVIAQYKDELIDDLLSKINKLFIPNKVIIVKKDETNSDLIKLSPFIEEQKPIDNKTTIYVCQNHVCKMPVFEAEEVIKILEQEPNR